MKTKSLITSAIFLIAILFSLSINAINSYNEVARYFDSNFSKTHVDQPANDKLIYDDLLFEELENENENENFQTISFLILPFINYSFNFTEKHSNFVSEIPTKLAVAPIFLSVRSLRI